MGLVFENGKVLRASFRGKYDDGVEYRVAFKNEGVKAEGHANAFGILDFEPDDNGEIFHKINEVCFQLESYHKSTLKVIDVSNLATRLLNHGMDDATENCFVRAMYRTYYHYTGRNIKVVKTTYKCIELTPKDLMNGAVADFVKDNISYKYILEKDGSKAIKYCEYLIDGKTVKSFGVKLEDGLIMPLNERGYISLFVQSYAE